VGDLIIKDEVGYIETRNEDMAYCYTAVLCYLAFKETFKVVEFKRTFIRTQYGKPVLAVYIAGSSLLILHIGFLQHNGLDIGT
jgi:hypothetical protein